MTADSRQKRRPSAACRPLSTDHLRRHARHIVLPEIGEAGQEKLAASSIFVVGTGGLGSSAAGFLAAAGIGRIGIADADRVELSNLQRQLLYETADIGQFKVDAAQSRLEEINPGCEVVVLRDRISAENAADCFAGYDLVVDGSDNFETRLAVNAACVTAKRTLVSAAISGFAAQFSTFKAHLGAPHPCYQCLVSALPEREVSCAQEGIVGPLAGMAGSFQALEAIRELLGIGTSLSGRLLRFDGHHAQWRESGLMRDPVCPVCSQS